jgi:hypothetical protein
MSEHTVHLIGSEHDEAATIRAAPFNLACHISFHYRDRVLQAHASDYFEAFCQIRLKLEPERLIPFCYGASMNVFPSGMGRDMGAGLKAYRLTLGVKPTMKDLVHIFDEAADVIPVYVAVQKKYFEDWLKSVGVAREKE